MTYDARNLIDQADYVGHERVIIGDGTCLYINLVGNAFIKTDLSCKKLCCVKSQETREVILKGVVDKRLYQFLNFNIKNTQSSTEAAPEFLTNSEPANDSLLWHAHLGHPSNKVLSTGKSRQLPFLDSKIVYTAPLQLVYLDIWGPAPSLDSNGNNGNAKRKHRHVVEMGLTLLADAGMPISFWGKAFQTAVYLINALPTPTLQNQSPMEVLFGKKPPYAALRVFGCLCYPHLRPYNHNKLQFRSEPAVFLGYGNWHKGYKCLLSPGRL
ncbi:uncharacterized protein LOC130950078 [Arachis stenosperma]|uniref:uncharacterized protein LOC130950078 n=1 Tax=Arachis stenosperma TaxID=217475 RepID=UPI0025AC73CE|nr:uncharacterized protein LOC130950078 [Arachis stenosperma]